MARLIRFFSIFTILSSITATHAADGKHSDKVPELKALQHYAGTWDVQITSKGIPFTKGEATATWALDGRFLQQSGELRTSDGNTAVKVVTLMTYDPVKKVYKSWTFTSAGTTSEAEGSWNAKTRTMTFVGKKDEKGVYSITTADFSKDDAETWSIVHMDGNGKLVSEMKGKNSRRKK